jgi:uroporphyrin-III C-methyltransferase
VKGSGFVYIVGAGPGDPGLITVKGLDCLRRSDVIIYDRLVHPDLLREAHSDAELIDVGKQPGKAHQIQNWINTLLVAKAAMGHTVCRLKGGDPFVFGRGGEEARVLADNEIPFEVVSGVSSVTAAPASVGIPLTHRNYAHGFMVITACHSKSGSENWTIVSQMVQSGGTVVILMGLARLKEISETLRILGCGDSTPVAVISNGTHREQECRIGRLNEIAERATALKSPSMIVIGSVVSECRFAENRETTVAAV